MSRPALTYAEPVPVRRALWVPHPAGERCGDVVLTSEPDGAVGDYEFRRFHLNLLRGGRLVRVFPKSRPYGYGSAGQAKRAVGKILTLVTADGGEA